MVKWGVGYCAHQKGMKAAVLDEGQCRKLKEQHCSLTSLSTLLSPCNRGMHRPSDGMPVT